MGGPKLIEPCPDCPENSFCGAISSRLRKFTQSARNRPAEAFFSGQSGQGSINFGPLRVVQKWRSIALIVQQKLTKRAIPCPDCPEYVISKKYLRNVSQILFRNHVFWTIRAR